MDNQKVQQAVENFELTKSFQQKRKAHFDAARRYRSILRGVLSSRYAKIEQEAIKHQIPIMNRELFIRFNIENSGDFQRLYEIYRQNGYKRDLMPVIQLIEKKRGYIVGNFIWTTLGEKVNSGIFIKVIDAYDGSEYHFVSIKEAERHFKLPEGVLYRPLKKSGKYKNLRVMLEA